jgi:glycosyltransferase involved in cell wall biosynthesis
VKILLIAYALGPSRGSEGAIGWGWASSLARVHEVTVISCTHNQHDVESYLESHPDLKLRVKWIDHGTHTRLLGSRFPYLWWLRRIVKLCKKLVAEEKVDVIQFVTFGSLSNPIQLWNLGVPFILGPVGGGQPFNPIYQEVLGPMPLSARLRNLRISLLPYVPRIRSMIQNAALVLATNKETEKIARRCGGKTTIFCDTGVREEFLLDKPPQKPYRSGLRMLWVGRMLYRKGIPIALHALKATGRTDLTLELLGTGPMESAWRIVVKDLGLEGQVTFHGQVPFAQVFDFYDKADLFVFPSVNDAFGSQLLEASSRGLPILTLDHQGAGTLIPDTVAWKVPVDTAKNTVEKMAEAMVYLANSRDKLLAMSEAAICYAHSESWTQRIDRMSSLYEKLLLETAK